MQDIRLVGNDGEYLNLETQTGDKFRLVLDESLRAAVKREPAALLDAVSISPREIQDAIRAGASAAEVAERHSVPLDYVDKFALTVIDEIGHIIASAQAVRISIAADRYTEATQVEFGGLLAERISSIGGTKTQWSAIKLENLPWQVSVTYEVAGNPVTARWAFDQRKLVLSPENEKAVELASGESTSSATSSRLRQVEPPSEETQVLVLPVSPLTSPVEESFDVQTNLKVVSSIEELTRSSLEALGDDQVDSAAAESPSVEPLAATADLLEALRRKRQAAPSVETTEPAEPEVSEVMAPKPETEQVAPKKGRPSMPSWDEIVFGTKADD